MDSEPPEQLGSGVSVHHYTHIQGDTIVLVCEVGRGPGDPVHFKPSLDRKTSAECYGRDNLAKPLRDFELVLQQIRTKAFLPDATRSGMLNSDSVADPKNSFTIETENEQEKI